MQRYIFSFLMLLIWMGFYSCSETTTGNKEEEELEVEQSVEEQAAVGFELNEYFQTGGEVETLTNPEDPELDASFLDVFGNLGKTSVLAKQAVSNSKHLNLAKLDERQLNKTAEIIPIVPVTDTTDMYGNRYREGAYWDTESNLVVAYKVYYEFVGFQFSDTTFSRKINYDSTAFQASLSANFSLDTSTVQIYNIKKYKEGFALSYVETVIIPTNWENGDPTSFTATSTSIFRAGFAIAKIVNLLEYNDDGSGKITRTIHFEDGTTSTTVFTFDGSNNGTFSRTFRDGTTVNGEFNDIEDDGNGFYRSLTDFKSHEYLDTIYKSAIVGWNPITGIFDLKFFRSVRFLNGDSSYASIEIASNESEGTSTISISRHNGANGEFNVQEADGETVLTGWWVTHDSLYVTVDATYNSEGTGEITYSVYSNLASFNNGDDPIATAHYNFSPVGDGSGSITFADGRTYDVGFNENGFGKLRQDGAAKRFNLFRK